MCQRASNLSFAEILFERMVAEQEVRPDIVSYRIMFNMFHEEAHWSEQTGSGKKANLKY